MIDEIKKLAQQQNELAKQAYRESYSIYYK